MLKEQAKLFNRIAIFIDCVVLLAAFMLVYWLRTGGVNELENYFWVLLIVIPVWHFLMLSFGLYDSMRMKSVRQIVASLAKAHLVGGVVPAALIYFIHPVFDRTVLAVFLVISFIFLLLDKIFLKLVLSIIRRKGYNTRNILIVGTGRKSADFIRLVMSHGGWGLRLIGVISLADEENGQPELAGRIIGTVDDLVRICREQTVDEVVFCPGRGSSLDMGKYIHEVEEMGITIRMVIDLYDSTHSRKELYFFHGEIPILTMHPKAFDSSQLFLKRCLDISGSIVGLAVTGFVFPFVALAIRLESPGPILFGQIRVGENGRTFRCWKFRSMLVDAEERKKDLAARNEMNGAMFKIADDPRVTRVGKFIRKTSIDELPQFWNVLKGEMSLVGTRPPTPDEVATYENWQRKRICIKPGISGLWQVSGRNQIQDFDEVVQLDIRYIEEWSLWFDIKLLFKTVWVVFVGRGAR